MGEDSGVKRQLSILPVEANNTIIIRGEADMLRRLMSVAMELDKTVEARPDLSVIFLNHADAEEMATLLREVANAQQGGEEGGSAGATRATISFFKPTNSIIISGDAGIQRMLQNVVAQHDVRRAQVLIEAIIVEVSDTAARELGIEYFITGDETNNSVPFTSLNFSNAQPSVLSAAGASILNRNDDDNSSTSFDFDTSDLAQAALISLLGVNGAGVGGVGEIGDTLFGGILTAIKQDTESNILSTPFATTLDNQTASLSVGQEIPITTGEQIGDDFSNAFRTVSREEVGVILEVTPQINEGGTVTLEIAQEISSVAGQIIDSSTDLITNKTRFTTTALVDNEDILVIGGLIDQTQNVTESKAPVIGDIPVLGTLFKSSGRSSTQRNLMVFIRPTILRDRDDSAMATQRKFDYIRARDMLRRGSPVSDLERLIDQVTGKGPRIDGERLEGGEPINLEPILGAPLEQ